MTSSPETSVELKLFEQHWIHLRHIEEQRLTLTNVFAVAAGATLTYFAATPDQVIKYTILVFLLVFSLFGFVFCLKVASLHEVHKKLGDWRLRLLHHGQFVPSLATPHSKSNWARFFSISLIFEGIYALCFNVALGVLLYKISQYYWPGLKVRITLGAVVVGLLGLACFVKYALHNQERSNREGILEPILSVKCPKCSTENAFEYVLWGKRDANDDPNVKQLLNLFIERQHPHHPPRFDAITFKDL